MSVTPMGGATPLLIGITEFLSHPSVVADCSSMKPVRLLSFPCVGSSARPIEAVDFHRELYGCPPFGVSDILLVVPSNIMPGWCFHYATIPL